MSSEILYLQLTPYAKILGHVKAKKGRYSLTITEWYVIIYYNNFKENGNFEPIQALNLVCSNFFPTFIGVGLLIQYQQLCLPRGKFYCFCFLNKSKLSCVSSIRPNFI